MEQQGKNSPPKEKIVNGQEANKGIKDNLQLYPESLKKGDMPEKEDSPETTNSEESKKLVNAEGTNNINRENV